MDHAAEAPWNRLTRSADEHFRDGRFADALGLYENALGLLRASTTDGALTQRMLMARIASHHNRAAALTKLGRLAEAEEEYGAAYAFVQSVVLDALAPVPLREAARCHCALAFAEWQCFRREQGRALELEREALRRNGGRRKLQ